MRTHKELYTGKAIMHTIEVEQCRVGEAGCSGWPKPGIIRPGFRLFLLDTGCDDVYPL